MSKAEEATPPERFPAPTGVTDVKLWPGLKEIYSHFSSSRRRQLYLVLALMALGALAELATIGAVIPFLSFLANPEGLRNLPWPSSTLGDLSIDTGHRLVAAAVLFGLFAVAAGVIRLQLAWLTQAFMFRLGHDLAVAIHRRILLQPYAFHLERNTSTLITALDKVELFVFDLLLPLMQTVIAAFIAAFIIAALVYIDPLTAIAGAVAFSAIYLLVSVLTKRRLAANSAVVATGYDERLQIIQESLGGIRDVIIDNSQEMYLRLFERVNSRLARARATTIFIAAAPRFVIESVGMIIIAAVALMIAQREGGLAAALPVLGAVALGAQRLLPLVQTVYTGWSTVAGHRSVVASVLEYLRLPPAEKQDDLDVIPLPLRDRITIENVSFAYPGRRAATLQSITFEIASGSAVAFVGETGGGKTTLADLLIGLLQPGEGRILVDGTPISAANARRWQRSIAHVPQTIFLADASISRNIALGLGDRPVDHERVVEAAKTAQLHDFVVSLPNGYHTKVGERGIRLSGGQRQRLGIARAIYKQAPVLVLDEATSALDEATELAVMDGLDRLREQGRTIIVIAHRLSTIARCDTVVCLNDGRLFALGAPEDVVGSAKVRRSAIASAIGTRRSSGDA